MSVRERWSAATRLDRGVVVAAFACLLLGALSRPVWRALRSRLAITVAYRADAVSDPWGSTWEHPDGKRIHSPGPNRTYEQGGGDDLLVLPNASVEPYLYGLAPYALIGFAVCFGLTYALARGEERTGFADEVGRAAVTAIPLGLYGVALAVALSVDRGGQPPVIDRLALNTVSPVPTPIVLAGLAYVCGGMFVLAVRMHQPLLEVREDYAYYVGADDPPRTP